MRPDGLPGVYACGDVAAVWRPPVARHVRTEHWTSAAAQGAAVARAILGRERAGGRRAVLLVGPVRAAAPARRPRRGLGPRGARGHARLVLARYHARDGSLVAVLLANRPHEVAAARRELAERRLAA